MSLSGPMTRATGCWSGVSTAMGFDLGWLVVGYLIGRWVSVATHTKGPNDCFACEKCNGHVAADDTVCDDGGHGHSEPEELSADEAMCPFCNTSPCSWPPEVTEDEDVGF